MSLAKPLFSIGIALCSAVVAVRAATSATNTSSFGFTGRELFPIDREIGLLQVADINGDGLNDLIVANNTRSKINILFNQTGRTNLASAPRRGVKRQINELPPDARFRIESIASEKRIASMVVADLNSDAKPDIAYYGEPRELVVQYGEGTNDWSVPRRLPINDGQLTQNALVAGDLNGDDRTDLLLLAENHIHFIAQKADGTLDEPQKIPVAGAVKCLQVVDLDGDGRKDLLLVNFDTANPIRFRLQDAAGRLGPEVFFTMPAIRAFCADQFDDGRAAQVVTIAQNSGRAAISHFVRKPAEPLAGGFKQGQFEVLPLFKTDKARRGLAWADVNGDGLADMLVAEPESGQITISFQEKDGSLGSPKTFPTLTGVSDVEVADWNGDGKPEIFLLSPEERQVGVANLDQNQRLPFPTLIPTDGKPLALALGPMRAGARPTLAIIVDDNGKRALLTITADGARQTQKLSESFQSNPSAMAILDVDQDGLADLVVLIPYEKIKILRQVADKPFEELDVAPPGGSIEQPWLSTADIDGDGKPELLLAQKNFLRAVVLKPETSAAGSTNKSAWVFSVKEQINGAASNSKLVAAAAMPDGTNGIPALFLLDAERKALTLCRRDAAGVWQVVRNVQLPVWDFNRLQPLALGGPRANAVAFLGLNAMAWMALEGDTWDFAELDSYETPIKDGYLRDVVAGDLNGDGRKDLVFLETAKNYIDVVEFTPDHKLVPGNRWQVFEERTFRARRSDMPEPREAVVADVTGDGKNDLIIVVHDRLIVYPQE